MTAAGRMTSFSDRFCIKLNDFQENNAASFHIMKDEHNFSDITLVCQDNQQMMAHKIILTACSPFLTLFEK